MTESIVDPRTKYYSDGFPRDTGTQPGLVSETNPRPDHGEDSYRGARRLTGRRALITGGDSGIGRAVAIAYAREGADVAISHLPQEQDDADDTLEVLRATGRTAVSLPGDITDEATSEKVVRDAFDALGGLDILVLNAGYQRSRDEQAAFSTIEFDRVMKTNLYAPFWMARTALPLMPPGSSVIVTSSIQSASPSPELLDYAMTKAAQVAFVRALASEQGASGIRVNAVAPGPIWTPLIPATDWPDKLPSFGQDTPLGRAGQPAELAGAYVYLASEDASYVSGAVLAVTGGKHL
ncbi:SDR family oxidoreductase [Microbacterium sp. NC79]|uniref:SDR family oxidoreductase n=1 Tax=Microbacterium sp. NC79 TaxID=2851009 RepID=UPI001C2C9C2F|nr:SDR family oxidoreductase [Microbacterium sp. NC79]MBV0894788.1 SDR family oxidoreductase [Microbacterium sp. NC79]